MLNRQEVFNTVYTKLREQGGPATDSAERCMYRAPNSKRCAIGHLIPDELYTPDIEGNGVTSDNRGIVSNILEQVYGELTSEDFRFFMRLQEAHDIWDKRKASSFDINMLAVARAFNLGFVV